MAVDPSRPRILIGPRDLQDRICRIMYLRATDEAWTEVWEDDSWRRLGLPVRHVLAAPACAPGVLAGLRIPDERGEWEPDVRG